MNSTGLHDYQVPAAEALLQALRLNGAALDGSDCGVGKSYHAAAVIRELKKPTLIVAPAISITSWRRVLEAMGTDADVISYEAARGGNTPFGWWEYPRPKKLATFLQCGFCQCKSEEPFDYPCPARGVHCVEVRRKEHLYGKFQWAKEIGLLVFDEAHKLSGWDSLQSELLISAKRRAIPTLLLSATLASSPLLLRGIGFCLGIHSLVDTQKTPGFYKWAARYGVRRIPMLGLQWAVGEDKKTALMAKLHSEIWPSRGCRVRISELGSAFPECSIFCDLVDLDSGGKIQELYKAMEAPLAALRHRAESDAPGPLSELLRLRQSVGLLKCPVMADLAREAVAAGNHVALFCNFRAEVEALCKLLGTNCFVDGSQVGTRGQAERQENVDRFQRDESPWIVCSPAGGMAIGLHDRAGKFPRVGIVSLGQSAIGFRQTTGRLCRSGSMSKSIYRVILAAGTVEESVHKKLSGRLNNLDALLDADLLADNLSLTNPQT